jgi:hypothetical protein
MPAIKFFKAPADFRLWLQTHHAKLDVLWLGELASYQPDLVRIEAIIHASILREALCAEFPHHH